MCLSLGGHGVAGLRGGVPGKGGCQRNSGGNADPGSLFSLRVAMLVAVGTARSKLQAAARSAGVLSKKQQKNAAFWKQRKARKAQKKVWHLLRPVTCGAKVMLNHRCVRTRRSREATLVRNDSSDLLALCRSRILPQFAWFGLLPSVGKRRAQLSNNQPSAPCRTDPAA